jgi:putative transcriptional regulator
MMSKKAFKSDAFESVHGSAEALCRTSVIDKATMRDFDAALAILTRAPERTPLAGDELPGTH